MDDIAVERIVLELEQVGVTRAVSQRLLREAVSIESYIEPMTQKMVVSVIARVAMERLAVETVTYPEDWWQAFRARWAPRWWLKRRPVRYTVVRIEARAYYPKVSMPEHGPRVALERLRT